MSLSRSRAILLALGILLLAGGVMLPVQLPVELSYVYSDSMEPTIGTNDGYVLIPASDIQVGDVITFKSEKKDAYVTHRVVGSSDRGFITKGDNNAQTDQESGYGYVQQSDVRGEVLTVGGLMVTIPHLAPLATVLKANFQAAVALMVLIVIGRAIFTKNSGLGVGGGRQPDRGVLRERDILRPILLSFAVFSFVMVLLATSVHGTTFVAVSHQTDAQQLLTVGEPTTKTILLEGTGPVFTYRIMSAQGMEITHVAANDTMARLTVRLPPPEHTGPQATAIRIHHYPAILPRAVLQRLHDVHPVLAAGSSVGMAVGAVYGLALLTIDGHRPIRKPRSRLLRRLL